jgi:MFS family permease
VVPPRARAIAVVFAANGLGGPSFLARLPERQADLGLSDGQLGLVLVGLSLGALVASPLAGRLVGTLGSRTLVLAAALTLGGCLWLTGAAPNAAVLFGALAVVGAADAAMDIAMNANGAAFETRSQATPPPGRPDSAARSVMHRLHGAWSVGALAAAGLAGVSAAAGVPLTVHLGLVGVVIGVGALASRRGLVPGRPPSGRRLSPVGTAESRGDADGPAPGPRRRRERGWWPLAVLGAATVGGALIEGGPTDWSAIQLERYGTGDGVAAMGVAAFMAGMFGGRLVGDWLTDRLGGARVLRIGTCLVAGGILLGAAAGHPAAFLAGLVVAGAGAAGFFPLAFSAAARTPGVSPGAGAATVSLAARLGFLAEPVVMGAVAGFVGLRWAFGLVAATALALAVAAPRIIPAGARLTPAPTADPRAP